ncbi:ribonuclease [Rhizobium sp. FKL33]|uniref:ribonuclease T2 family protein n=1 Tax=Rhizobium sp. FKL33 TaxID=2562307 RepID=UPI0010C040DA|nr:ribonuclease [Rhizobium sp. FKL33]
MRAACRLLTALAMAASAAGVTGFAAKADTFDFYVLSLSWSPTWCAADAERGDNRQCKEKRRFIVHGLWPQNERGWPQFCKSSEPDRVPSSMMREIGDVMPSIGLAGHQWRKHGACSGLTQERYFRLLKEAYGKIKLPAVIFDGKIDRKLGVDEIENLMTRANPGLARDGVAISCDGGQLEEIRICMTKSLSFKACDEVDRKSCRAKSVSIPSAQ